MVGGMCCLLAAPYTVTAERMAHNKRRAGRPIFVVRLGFQKRRHMAAFSTKKIPPTPIYGRRDVLPYAAASGSKLSLVIRR